MPIDRNLWKRWLTPLWVPAWPCPRCRGSLSLLKETFREAHDAATVRHRHRRSFDPESYTGRFACLLQCTRTDCQEVCAVSGEYVTEMDEDGYYSSCRPQSISPPPPMIQIPENCPEAIRQEVVAAFTLYWCDYASCLNRIRNALELLLTDLKVSRTMLNASKKKVRLSLHQRIELLEKKRPKLKDICERMMAVKHLGNAGSHPGIVVERNDVFDGFDILERVLYDTYSDHESELAKAVKQINKRKRPRAT
jgi:Domain of unknown function (DUF4145)